ncbi:MAG TPA: hypothetical protein EYO59_06470 [Chromatiaceae bacterium]|jgi:hypothetical protein|nr:hypothetical protein [Chromatiaceae bacterium]
MSIIQVSPGEIATVGKDPKATVKANIPRFMPIGAAGMNYQARIDGIDMAAILRSLSSNATWLFWTLVQLSCRFNNQAELTSKTLTKYEKHKVTKGYKELLAKDLVKRYKREHYIINPKALLPEFDNFEDIWKIWNALTPATLKKPPNHLFRSPSNLVGLA